MIKHANTQLSISFIILHFEFSYFQILILRFRFIIFLDSFVSIKTIAIILLTEYLNYQVFFARVDLAIVLIESIFINHDFENSD